MKRLLLLLLVSITVPLVSADDDEWIELVPLKADRAQFAKNLLKIENALDRHTLTRDMVRSYITETVFLDASRLLGLVNQYRDEIFSLAEEVKGPGKKKSEAELEHAHAGLELINQGGTGADVDRARKLLRQIGK